jgi:protease IV
MTEQKKGFFRRIFGGIGRAISWLRVVMLNLVFVVFLIVFLTAIFKSAPVIDVQEGSALLIAPRGVIVEQQTVLDPLTSLMQSANEEESETRLWDIVDAIDEATSDPRISAVILKLDGVVGLGLVKAEEIARALQAFKATERPVIAYGEYYSQSTYRLASEADEVYMHPMGVVFMSGFDVYRNYFKSLLDSLLVDFHIFRVGEYKSALEPYIRDDMSEEAKRANQRWLDGLWSGYKSTVGERRNISPERLQQMIDGVDSELKKVSGNTAAMAVSTGLVDEILSRPEMEDMLVERFGEAEDGGANLIHMNAYLQERRMAQRPVDADRIGVIVAQGEIIDGDSMPGAVGGDSLAHQIQRAESDDSVKALVLRVDSPGGSVFASEVIREQLLRFKATGKPLVVSMSSLAASGGYWIAADADKILASAQTLTGSIGIFGAMPTIQRGLSKLGVNTDGLGTTAMAGAGRLDLPMNPLAAATIQQSIEFGYQRFLEIVADGRNMTTEAVDNIARGRVWTGGDALEKGLVDAHGGLQDALAVAAELAELEQYEPKWISPEMSFLESLTHVLNVRQADLLDSVLGRVGMQWAALQTPYLLVDPRQQFVLCTECAAP